MPWDFLGTGPCSSQAGDGVGVESGGSGFQSLPFLRNGTYRVAEASKPQNTHCWGWWSGPGGYNLHR